MGKIKAIRNIQIDLSLIDDIEAAQSKATNAALDASGLAQKAAAAYSEANTQISNAESLAGKALASAKELGAKSVESAMNSKLKQLGSDYKRYSKNENTLKGIN